MPLSYMSSGPQRARPSRVARVSAALALAASAALLTAPPAGAQQPPLVTTPYPAVAVGPGEEVTFDLTVAAPGPQRVDLAVEQVPPGWRAELRGGGFVVDGVYGDPANPPDVSLEVTVPPDAAEGPQQLVVAAASGAARSTLPLTLRVAEGVAGGTELTAEFPSLRAASDATFEFDLELANNRPEDQTYSLEAMGPEGWRVTARPSSQEQASTATVAAGETARITVEADPPDDVPAGRYPVLVRATGGGQAAQTELTAEVTGTYTLTLTTPDERLNADVAAGRTTDVALVLRNEGTAPLSAVALEASPPSDWEVTFDPPGLDVLPPGETAEVTARITPAGEAVAGDYVVSLDARAEEAEAATELRTTVETSGWWGAVGIGLIIAALSGLGAVFRRYGRR